MPACDPTASWRGDDVDGDGTSKSEATPPAKADTAVEPSAVTPPAAVEKPSHATATPPANATATPSTNTPAVTPADAPTNPPVAPSPSAPPEKDAPTPAAADASVPPNCPAGTRATDEHPCFIDLLGEWTFTEIAFDTPITLTLEVPARPAKTRWAKVDGAIPWPQLRTELAIKPASDSFDLSLVPTIFGRDVVDSPIAIDEASEKPFFWWPVDDAPVLVLPHRAKQGQLRATGVVLARKTETGWRAAVLDVTRPDFARIVGGAALLESGLGFRFDGLELFTLAQVVNEDDRPTSIPGMAPPPNTAPPVPRDRWLCRIRWDRDHLARACLPKWTEVTGYAD